MTDLEINISRMDETKGGKLIATVIGREGEAEMTWSSTGDALRIVDHTAVADSLRGAGVGLALADRMVEEARDDGVRLYPLCPFFLATARKHPEWHDVVEMPPAKR